MKHQDLYLGLLSFGVCLTVASFATSAAFAQCVISHVGVQLNMSPTPATQTSNVQMYSPVSCTGNTSSSTAVQVNTGNHGHVKQHQEVFHEIRSNEGNTTAVNGQTIKNSVVVPVNVKTPKNFYP